MSDGLDLVTLDQQKFKQVLYNLLSNAVKFTDEGGQVDKRAEKLLRLEPMVASSCADAGSGSSALKAVIRSICEIQDWECRRSATWA